MTPSSKTASYITSKITSRTLSLFLLPKTNRLVWYLNPPIQESHDICHGQESLIRGMVIKNPWSGIRKCRYNMNMCLCKYIHIHLHLHPTLEDPLKLLYNAVHIYKYTCICPLPLLFWHPNMTFAKTSAPSFGKRSHHDTMVSKGALEAIPSSTAQKWNVLLQRSKRCTAQKYGTWKRGLTVDFDWQFDLRGRFAYRWEKRWFFFGVGGFLLLCL